ncbi:molybdate ABC transporter substrate-binding protein [Lutibaculum baratangense]|uniref:Molybdate-binding protein ModA n=1 Tax=Lutibaculum baratangense AMV1 TaxID=631454 RepID=V4RJG2_9HYPH|nr:molybdate ABC transporter substrate-binding protein [Lutibaculum baratangense]ESR26241.1 Molybdenum ABC transporter, periplasmic molybdenum-binding protein ModA [Lutibaculum baratangense AMV1]
MGHLVRHVLPFALLLAALALPARAEPPTVFAAASLTDAMEAVGRAYQEETGEAVRFSFASSSTLARQVEAGAPADIIISANEQWMDYLQEREMIDPTTRMSPISNGLVLVAPRDGGVDEVDITAETDLAALLGTNGRLAVGDPDHVPAGIYAKQSLEALGFWGALEQRLARADDVRAALTLVSRGEASLGIVYATDAQVDGGVKVVGHFPTDSHDPITYPFAVVADAPSGSAARLFDFLTGEEALAIYERHGFRRN